MENNLKDLIAKVNEIANEYVPTDTELEVVIPICGDYIILLLRSTEEGDDREWQITQYSDNCQDLYTSNHIVPFTIMEFANGIRNEVANGKLDDCFFYETEQELEAE